VRIKRVRKTSAAQLERELAHERLRFETLWYYADRGRHFGGDPEEAREGVDAKIRSNWDDSATGPWRWAR
jgi:hypothetical protein